MSRRKKPPEHPDMAMERKHMIANGLTEAILGFNPESIGTPLNQVDTLFLNNRYYLVSNMRQLLSEIYVEHGIVQTIVDVPVDDAMRGGIKIQSQQLDETELKELQGEVEREDILGSVVGRAHKWNRLFGGAGVIIVTDQDPQTPLNIDAVNDQTPLSFKAVDMWELYGDQQSMNDDRNVQHVDQLDQMQTTFNYYNKKIHKSRVILLKGLTAPSFIRPRLRGWGFSVCETLVNSINQYLKANNLIFEVLDEFKIDVYKIKNLAQTLMSPTGTAIVQKRIQLANQQKSFQHAIVMDGEDDFIAKELSFAGISETMTGIRMQIASDMRMPLTKVFGISATGFSSGEDDIENYNAMVESTIRAKAKFDILKVVGIMCQKKFGHVPDDLEIDFEPLRVLSSEQEENVKTQKFARITQAQAAGLISPKEYKEACNKENLLGIQIEVNDDVLEVKGPEGAETAPKGPKSSISAPEAKT